MFMENCVSTGLEGTYKMRTLKILVSVLFILVSIFFVVCIIKGLLFKTIFGIEIITLIIIASIILNLVNMMIHIKERG